MFSILNIYKKALIGHRNDYLPFLNYFTVSDFEDLQVETFTFQSQQKADLRGFIYSSKLLYNGKNIAFCHGIGAGHRAYLTLIAAFCQKGYRVYTFDITGCGASPGPNIRSAVQSIADLDSFLDYYRRIETTRITAVGHSWGGLAVSNIAKFQPDIIDKIIDLAGPLSFKTLMKQNLGIMAPFFYRSLYKYESKLNLKYLDSSAVEVLQSLKIPALLIQSRDDDVVSYKKSLGYLQKHLRNDRLSYLIVEGRRHNPYLSREASRYFSAVFDEYHRISKELTTLDSRLNYFHDVDWRRITELDDELFSQIETFLER